jgi:hypothetical protein
MKRIKIQCAANAKGGWRHRWERVAGTMSTPEHPYTERRCVHCHLYESDVVL